MKFKIKTKGFCDVIDITEQVKKTVSEAKIKDGVVFIFVPATTVGLTIMEYEPNTVKDIQSFFDKITPQDEEYAHDETWGDANGFSHVRSALLKPFIAVPIENGKLVLGNWQSIVLVDFDNKAREREIVVKILSTATHGV